MKLATTVVLLGCPILVWIAGAQSTPVPAPTAVPASSATDSSGTWTIDGDFGGFVVHLNCVVAQKEKALSGSCTGDDGKPRPLTGSVSAEGLTWAYDSDYDGQPLHITITARLTSDGAKLSGKMAIAPMGMDADVAGTKQPASAPPTAGTPPAQ